MKLGRMVCEYCGHAIDIANEAEKKAGAEAMLAHDDVCPNNPVRIERDKLRAEVVKLREQRARLLAAAREFVADAEADA